MGWNGVGCGVGEVNYMLLGKVGLGWGGLGVWGGMGWGGVWVR